MNPAERVGATIDGRYEIIGLIGRGAMADVYKARDAKTDKDVALKILRRTLTRDNEAMQRFQREARVQEMVQHRNVAALYGGGATPAREPYLIVELLRGRSLRTVLRKDGRVDLLRAASFMWQALQGLAAVHTMGVRHRDLKPANLMLEPSPGPVDRIVLIDFGFAAFEGSAKLTAQGHVVGSLSYLAPERLRGEPGDERSDLYAIGVIFYESLVGRPPFIADDDFDLINAHLQDLPPPLSHIDPSLVVPPAIEQVIMRALAKTPEQRWASATAMANDLEAAMQDYEP